MKKLISILLFVISLSVYAKTTSNDFELFQKIFLDWTKAFNQKDLKTSCDLFSQNVTANYQGVASKNYDTICNGFKKIFNEKNKQYQYSFKLHHVYRSNNLAAIRITWYLRIYENNKLQSQTQDEGIDVFQKNGSEKWQIVNYIGYPVAN